VIDVFSGIGAMAGAVGNGTSINMDDEGFEEDDEDSGDNENDGDDGDNEDNQDNDE
jgi:hypothetical protein